jgi:hypothetical protein
VDPPSFSEHFYIPDPDPNVFVSRSLNLNKKRVTNKVNLFFLATFPEASLNSLNRDQNNEKRILKNMRHILTKSRSMGVKPAGSQIQDPDHQQWFLA